MTDYALLIKQLKSLAGEEPYYVPLMANASALLRQALPDINWAGFYIVRGGALVLGPFQGKPACIRIEPGRGVCGTAVSRDRIQRVPDVHKFPGHIACDCASNSEIVVPIHAGGVPAAVLDIDSPVLNRFTQEDEAGLAEFAKVIEDCVSFSD